MADLNALYQALRNADAAGDKDHLLYPAFNRLQQEVRNGNAIGPHHH